MYFIRYKPYLFRAFLYDKVVFCQVQLKQHKLNKANEMGMVRYYTGLLGWATIIKLDGRQSTCLGYNPLGLIELLIDSANKMGSATRPD